MVYSSANILEQSKNMRCTKAHGTKGIKLEKNFKLSCKTAFFMSNLFRIITEII